MNELLLTIGTVMAYAGVLITSVMVGKVVNDAMTPYSVDVELTTNDNNALAISFTGYVLAIVFIFIGTLLGESQGLVMDIVLMGGYSLMGIILLNLSRYINDKLILHTFSNIKEIIEDRNVGTGAVQFGTYVATGLIIAGSVHGTGGGPHTALAFFVAGQIALILFMKIYNKLTPYDIHEEIEKDNVAAGVACAGWIVAFGIIMMKACSGAFIGWRENFSVFLVDVALAIILLPVIRLLIDKLLLPQSKLHEEISRDQNLGSAFFEAVTLIAFSIVIFFILP